MVRIIAVWSGLLGFVGLAIGIWSLFIGFSSPQDGAMAFLLGGVSTVVGCFLVWLSWRVWKS